MASLAAYCDAWVDPARAMLGYKALHTATKAARDKRVRDWISYRNLHDGATVPSYSVMRNWNVNNGAETGWDAAIASQSRIWTAGA